MHFQLLFQEDGLSDGDMSSEFRENVPSIVNSEDNDDLMKPFTEQEILHVVWDMELDKSPGPDGFSFHFYRFCWNIIKPYLIPMVLGLKKS